MHSNFYKFPRTPHLWWPLDRAPKDDRVLDSASAREFLSGKVVVEEKVDGANLGLSVDEDGAISIQNRGSLVERGAHPQFQPMWSWIAQRNSTLVAALRNSRILFGEWLFAVHSVQYDRLPDWFLGFDIYDRHESKFWSTHRRDALFEHTRVSPVPRLFAGRVSLRDLQVMLDSQQSRVGAGPVEGLYVRRESSEWLEGRAKIVRPEFLMAIEEHWSARPLERNRLIAQ